MRKPPAVGINIKTRTMRILLLSIIIIISSNFCYSQEKTNVGELNGIIEVGKGKRKRTLDYDFKVTYSNDSCVNGIGKLLEDFSLDIDSLDFVAPKFADNKKDLMDYLINEIHYPKYAIENGIEGKVFVHFEITRTGEVKNIWIRKGVSISIDKETERIIRKLRLLTPPLLKGKPIDLCIDIPINYELG